MSCRNSTKLFHRCLYNKIRENPQEKRNQKYTLVDKTNDSYKTIAITSHHITKAVAKNEIFPQPAPISKKKRTIFNMNITKDRQN